MKINHCRGTSQQRILHEQTKNDYKQSRGYIKEWGFEAVFAIHLS